MTITVDDAAESFDLTTLVDLKATLGITDGSQDALLAQYITRASSAIVQFTGREFAAQGITETLPGFAVQNLVLKRFPIVAVTTVKLEDVLVDAVDYVVQQPNSGFIFNKCRWTDTFNSYDYEVEYDYGYNLPSFTSNPLGAPDLPAAVEQAAILLSKAMFLSRSRDTSISKESVPNVYSASYGGSGSVSNIDSLMTGDIVTLLEPYRAFKVCP